MTGSATGVVTSAQACSECVIYIIMTATNLVVSNRKFSVLLQFYESWLCLWSVNDQNIVMQYINVCYPTL